MTGRQTKIIAAVTIAGLVIGYISKRSCDSFKGHSRMLNESDLNTTQCLERLKEFFITRDSLCWAEEEFNELLGMGFSPIDSFEITITKRSII